MGRESETTPMLSAGEYLAYQARVEDELETRLDELADWLTYHHLWELGDGYGGLVIEGLKERRPPQNQPPKRKPTKRSLRQRLIRRDGSACCGCGIVGARLPEGQVLHVHHIVPVSRGGSDDLANLELRCPPCHREVHA